MKTLIILSFVLFAAACAPSKQVGTAGASPPPETTRTDIRSWQIENVVRVSVAVRDVYVDNKIKTFVFEGAKAQKLIATLKLVYLNRQGASGAMETGELELTLNIDNQVHTQQFDLMNNRALMFADDPEDGYSSNTYITAEFLQRFDETN